MSDSLYDETLNEPKLEEAKQRLEAFEKRVFTQNRMARLRRESPRHPWLLGMTVSLLVACASILLGAGVAIVPMVDTSLVRTFAQNPALNGLPYGLMLLGVCGIISWAGFRGLAVLRATDSPLLPHNAAELNRLRSDVQRMRAQIDVNERLTGTPAPSRVQASYY